MLLAAPAGTRSGACMMIWSNIVVRGSWIACGDRRALGFF